MLADKNEIDPYDQHLIYEIQLKFREKAKGENTDTLIQGRTQTGQAQGSRREKERIIGEVVIKVSEWRRLYMDQGVTLENAAQKIGISKKSLDDYFLQLRNGQTNRFNFNEHKNDKMQYLLKSDSI